jgi:hypothetical protein
MGKDLIPDYQPSDGSYQVGGGNWHYGQDMVGLALDSMLTGYGTSTLGVTDSNTALTPFERMLYNVPLDVLKMFKPFTFGTTDADWADQYSAVQAIMKTFRPKSNKLQELLDGIAGLTKPGASNTPMADALQVLLGLKTVAELAERNAQLALLGVEGLKATQAGGSFDEFDNAIADALPTTSYTSFTSGAGSGGWGPDGNGKLVYKPKGVGARSQWYRRNDHPLTTTQGTVTVVLSNAPAPAVPDAYVYLCARWDAASQARLQARIGQTALAQTCTVQFQTVDAAGVATNVGTEGKGLPRLEDGDVLAMTFTGVSAAISRNGISGHSVGVPSMPTGQHIGFGLAVPNYLLPPHPGAELAGLAWHP